MARGRGGGGPVGGVSNRSLTDEEQREVADVLRRWLERLRIALSAYNDANTRTLTAERRLGVPATALTALVGTGVFATLQADPGLGLRIATGTIAIVAAVLIALQTFLRQAERAEQYREAARSYSRIRRRIEHALLFPPETRAAAEALVTEVGEALAEAARGKPNVPQRVWDRAEYKVRGTSDARGLRAAWLRMRNALDFGMSERRARPLAEDHERYFSELETATPIALSRLTPSTPPSEQPAAVETARMRMLEAAAGTRSRRSPIEVREDSDGRFVIVDGNATFAVAQQDGWETVPARIVEPEDGDDGEPPR